MRGQQLDNAPRRARSCSPLRFQPPLPRGRRHRICSDADRCSCNGGGSPTSAVGEGSATLGGTVGRGCVESQQMQSSAAMSVPAGPRSRPAGQRGLSTHSAVQEGEG